jgi:uncharacterized protein
MTHVGIDLMAAIIVGAGLCTVTVAGCLWIAIIAILAERRAFRPVAPSREVSIALPQARTVSLDSEGINIHGEFVDAKNGRVVLLVHGTEAALQDMYARAEMLIERGYGVMLIDLPGHGQSGGLPTWDEQERKAVRKALDYCQQQPCVTGLGVLGIGFSSGGYILAQVAAYEPRLAAVVLEGCFTSIKDLVDWQYRRYGWFSRYPALWTDCYYGMKPKSIQPIDVVQNIAPRATFVIAGSKDQVVPVFMSKRLYDAAQSPKELWIVDGAAHGDYQRVAPAEYARRVTEFFERA